MDTRGSDQNQRQPGRQSNYFQVRPELAGSLRSGRLRPDLTEQQVTGLINPLNQQQVTGVNSPLNRRPADCQNTSNELRLTVCQNTSDELGLVTGIIESPSEQQGEGQTCNIIDQAVDQSVVECGERRMSTDPGDGPVGQQGDIMTSPTTYSEDNMPRTVEATRFKMVVLKAQSLRTQMAKLSENIEGYIEEIKELESEDNTEESEYFLKRWADADREFKKVEEIKAEHEGLVTKIRLMCGFMMSTGHEDGAVATKVQGDAKEALDNIEKAEKEVDTNVRQFRKTNRKYLMGKKKKPTTQVTEGQARAPAPVANSLWILQMATKMEPEAH